MKPAKPNPDEPSSAQDLLEAGRAHYQSGRLEDAVKALSGAAQEAALHRDPSVRMQALLALGRTERDLGSLEPALSHLEEAHTLADHLQDSDAVIAVHNLKGTVLATLGEPVRALTSLERGLALAAESGNDDQQINLLINCGNIYREIGDFPKAYEASSRAYRLLEQKSSLDRRLITVLINLGQLHLEQGDRDRAQQEFARALNSARETSDPTAEIVALNNLANLERHTDPVAAQEQFHTALAKARQLGLRQFVIDNLDGLGQVYLSLGQVSKALLAHQEALKIAEELGDRTGQVDALLNLGRDFLALGEHYNALSHAHHALKLAEQSGLKRSIYEAHRVLTDTYEATGNPVKALSHHRAFYQAERSVFNAENERKTRQLEAQFDLEKLRYEVEIARTARMEAEMKVAERTAELEQSQLEMLNRLAIAAEYRDDQTGQHTLRVGRLAAAVARALHWLPQEADILDKAARLHDIGKIGIPDEILLKSEKLTAEEFERMKQHTIFGAKILSGGRSRLVRMAEEIARAHHEHWDGNGYPYGLEGQQIPIEARIVAVIDMFDALTHERPYKRAWSKAEALEEIRAHSGSRFDPSVVQAALGVLK